MNVDTQSGADPFLTDGSSAVEFVLESDIYADPLAKYKNDDGEWRGGVRPPNVIEKLDDIVWLNPSSEQMSQEDWDNGWARSLGVFLNGDAIPTPDRLCPTSPRRGAHGATCPHARHQATPS